jgi:hypothetical protein
MAIKAIAPPLITFFAMLGLHLMGGGSIVSAAFDALLSALAILAVSALAALPLAIVMRRFRPYGVAAASLSMLLTLLVAAGALL